MAVVIWPALDLSSLLMRLAIVVLGKLDGRGLDDGKLVAEIIPELWLMNHYNVQLSETLRPEEHVGDLAVLTAKG